MKNEKQQEKSKEAARLEQEIIARAKRIELMKILKDPDLFNLITEKEFDKKICREYDSRKTIFLVTCMRLVENRKKATDNLIVNANSGTGKDHVSEAVFGIIPENEKEELLRITPKVLAYTRNRAFDKEASWNKTGLRLEDVDNVVLNDNSFKTMQSASPNKINYSKVVIRGKVVPFEIQGKPSMIITIATAAIKNEQLRRNPICTLDEGIDQTKEILKRQAECAKNGYSLDYDPEIINSLKLLDLVKVKIPFADDLIKLFNPQEVIIRTHFDRFLDYIKASCALHQYQREKDKEGFFLADPKDYDIARIALIKTTSNILMIPLTKIQQTILACFEKEHLERRSIDDLMELKEIEKLDITPEWFRRQIDFLVSKSFLTKDKEKRLDEAGKVIPKPIFIYSYNPLQKLNIPEWKDLAEFSSNTSNSRNTSFSSFTSDSRVNEVNEVKNQLLHIDTTVETIKISDNIP
jgi:hypothetical protein